MKLKIGLAKYYKQIEIIKLEIQSVSQNYLFFVDESLERKIRDKAAYTLVNRSDRMDNVAKFHNNSHLDKQNRHIIIHDEENDRDISNKITKSRN